MYWFYVFSSDYSWIQMSLSSLVGSITCSIISFFLRAFASLSINESLGKGDTASFLFELLSYWTTFSRFTFSLDSLTSWGVKLVLVGDNRTESRLLGDWIRGSTLSWLVFIYKVAPPVFSTISFSKALRLTSILLTIEDDFLSGLLIFPSYEIPEFSCDSLSLSINDDPWFSPYN